MALKHSVGRVVIDEFPSNDDDVGTLPPTSHLRDMSGVTVTSGMVRYTHTHARTAMHSRAHMLTAKMHTSTHTPQRTRARTHSHTHAHVRSY